MFTYVENSVLLSNDVTIAYANEPRPEESSTVNFSDITHITENSQVEFYVYM